MTSSSTRNDVCIAGTSGMVNKAPVDIDTAEYRIPSLGLETFNLNLMD